MRPWMSALVIVVTAVLLQQGIVEGARVKIHLSPEVPSVKQHLLRPRQIQSACTDGVIQSACKDKISVNTTGLYIQELRLDDRVSFFSSDNAKGYVDQCIFDRSVFFNETPHDTVTVRDVFSALMQGGCYPFFYGGLVRDLFLEGTKPADVDVEAHCALDDVQRICVERWGTMSDTGCRVSTRAHIGVQNDSPDDIIDAASTNSTFFANLSALEYTVNSLAYDLNGNNSIIVDLSGVGVEDVCNKTIRIPSDDGSVRSWDDWRQMPNINEGRLKLYRFWKLRFKGFTPFNKTLRYYIVQHVLQAINDTTNDPNSFEKFYCKTVYDGKYDEGTKTCSISIEKCTEREDTAATYRQLFSEDFGDNFSTLKAVIPIATCGECTELIIILLS